MNWVGGVRRRVLLREEERRRQDQFFAAHASARNGHRAAPSIYKLCQRRLNPHPRLGSQHSRNEEIICQRIQTGSLSARSRLDVANTSAKCPTVDSNTNATTSEKASNAGKSDSQSETSDIIIRKNGKNIIIRPSSLHGPFSRFLLQLDAKGIEMMDQMNEGKSRGGRRREISKRKEQNHSHSKEEVTNVFKRQAERNALEGRPSDEKSSIGPVASEAIGRSSRSELSLEKRVIKGKHEPIGVDVTDMHMRRSDKRRENVKDKCVVQSQTIKTDDLRNGGHTAISKQIQDATLSSKHGSEKKRMKSMTGINSENRKRPTNEREPLKKRKHESGKSKLLEAEKSLIANRHKEISSSHSSDGRERDRKTYEGGEQSVPSRGSTGNKNKASRRVMKTFSSSLLSGAPRIRKILTLSPERYPGRCIWEPLELGKYDASCKGGKHNLGNEGKSEIRNENDIQRTKKKVSRGNASQSFPNTTSVKIDKDKLLWEENRLAVLIGSKPLQQRMDLVDKWQSEHHGKPTLSNNHLTENSGPECELNNIHKQFVDSQQPHQQKSYESRTSRNISQSSADENHKEKLKYPPRLKLGERKLDINNKEHSATCKSKTSNHLLPANKRKLSSMVREISKAGTDSSFILRGRDKTPYMEKDLTLATPYLGNNTSGGSSNKSSRTPSDSNFDKSLEESFCNEGKEFFSVGCSDAKGPFTAVDTYAIADTQGIGNIGSGLTNEVHKRPIMKPRFMEKCLQFSDDSVNSFEMYQSPYLHTKGAIDDCINEEDQTMRDLIQIGQRSYDFSPNREDIGDWNSNGDFENKNFYCEGVAIPGYKCGEIRQPAVCFSQSNSCQVEMQNDPHSALLTPYAKMDNLHDHHSSIASSKNTLIQMDHIQSVNKAAGNLMVSLDERNSEETKNQHLFLPATQTSWEFKVPHCSEACEPPPTSETICDIHAEYRASQLAEQCAKTGDISAGDFSSIKDCSVLQRSLHFEAEYVFDWNGKNQNSMAELERRGGKSEDFTNENAQDKQQFIDTVYPVISGHEETWPIMKNNQGTFHLTHTNSTNQNKPTRQESMIKEPPATPLDTQGNDHVINSANSPRLKFANENDEKVGRDNNVMDNSLVQKDIVENGKESDTKLKKVRLNAYKRKVYTLEGLDDQHCTEENLEVSSKAKTQSTLRSLLLSTNCSKNLKVKQTRPQIDPEQAVRQFNEVMSLDEDDSVQSEGSSTSSSGTSQQVAPTWQTSGQPSQAQDKSELEKIGEALLLYNTQKEGKLPGLTTTKIKKVDH